jgi:hypothetical protein
MRRLVTRLVGEFQAEKETGRIDASLGSRRPQV